MRLPRLVPWSCTALMQEEAPPASPQALERVPLSPVPRRRRQQVAHGGPAGWRPSLGAIAEVGTTAAAGAAAGDKEVRPAGRPGKAMVGLAGLSGRVLHRSHGDEYRQTGVPATMDPTAFLF